ncbi:MAG: helix-turn-helix transcriptional regulator [Oscillibacter sp.]|nr:helix-turn-helix transcriptional regulator [Oscillibacter sp.]
MRQMEPREIKPAAADQTVRGLLAMPLAQILPLSAGTLHQDPGCPECYTLIAAVQGNATVSSYPRSILLEAGQVMALSPGYAWDLQAVSECLCIIVRLEGDAAGRLLELSSSVAVFRCGAAVVRENILPLTVIEDEYGAVSGEAASARAYNLLVKLRSEQTAGELPELVESAIAIIQEEFPFLEGLDELAERLEVSKAHLSRSFSRKTGISPGKYITQVRISYAKLLLQEEDASITYAAEASGFANANYFAKVFRRETGMSPSEYLEGVPRRKRSRLQNGPALW